MTELSDQTLLSYWYRHRNAEAFHVLAARHARMVYATALRVLRDPHDAEDVSQESFLALARTKRPPSRHVAAWLHRTAYHAALKILRTRQRRHARDIEYHRTQPDAARAEWDDICEVLDDAVAALPEAWREPLVRHFFEQESHAAIAAALGVPRQTVTHRIGKGIEQVRQQLKQKGVIAPTGALLATLIQENSASALPMSAAAGIGRIALAATPSVWAVAGTYAGGAALKVAAALLVAGVGVVVWSGIGLPERMLDLELTPAVADRKSINEVSKPEAPPNVTFDSKAVTAEPKPNLPLLEGVLAALQSPKTTSNPSSISGIVTLPNGRPYAGANVMVLNILYSGAFRYPENTHFCVKTDSRGRFEQTRMPSAEYSITVSEPESTVWSSDAEMTRVTLAPGEHRDDLKLVFGTEGDLTISGTVVDSDGKALEGVQVFKFGPAARAASTDAQGRFTITHLPEGEVLLAVVKTGYNGLNKTFTAGEQNARMEMFLPAAVECRVIDAKTRKPLTQFEATFMMGTIHPARASLFDSASTFASANGAFQFPLASVGEVTVFARAAGYDPALMSATVASGETLRNVTIELEPTITKPLEGKVLAEDGSPISGASIYMGYVSLPNSREKHVVATTDSAGNFNIDDASSAIAFVSAWHPDFAPNSAPAAKDTTIVLKRAGRLNVEVLSQGIPMPKAGIRINFTGSPNLGYAKDGTTDQDGRVSINEIVPGAALIQLQLAGGRTQIQSLNFAPGEEKSIRFEVPPGEASLDGVVFDGEEPAATGHVSLFVETAAGSELFQQNIDSDGTFSFQSLPAGNAQLVAQSDDTDRRSRVDGIVLTAGQTTEVTLDATVKRSITGGVAGLPRGASGKVYIFHGALDYQGAIEATAASRFRPEFAGVGIVGENGAYELAVHEPGTYTLLLSTGPLKSWEYKTYQESRVVKVSENDDLVSNFNLAQ